MTSSNGNIFRVTGPLCGEFTGPGEFPSQRPVTRGFDVFFDQRMYKRLSKQPWGWRFETHRGHYDVIVMGIPQYVYGSHRSLRYWKHFCCGFWVVITRLWRKLSCYSILWVPSGFWENFITQILVDIWLLGSKVQPWSMSDRYKILPLVI